MPGEREEGKLSEGRSPWEPAAAAGGRVSMSLLLPGRALLGIWQSVLSLLLPPGRKRARLASILHALGKGAAIPQAKVG